MHQQVHGLFLHARLWRLASFFYADDLKSKLNMLFFAYFLIKMTQYNVYKANLHRVKKTKSIPTQKVRVILC